MPCGGIRYSNKATKVTTGLNRKNLLLKSRKSLGWWRGGKKEKSGKSFALVFLSWYAFIKSKMQCFYFGLSEICNFTACKSGGNLVLPQNFIISVLVKSLRLHFCGHSSFITLVVLLCWGFGWWDWCSYTRQVYSFIDVCVGGSCACFSPPPPPPQSC